MKESKNKSPLELIGERVQLKRKELGLTQEQFADKYGYPRTTLAKLEAGLRDFKSTELLKLAEQLDVSCDYLLGRTRAAAADDLTQAVVEHYGLSEEALKVLADMPAIETPSNDEEQSEESNYVKHRQRTTQKYRDTLNKLLVNINGKQVLAAISTFFYDVIEANNADEVPTYSLPFKLPNESGTWQETVKHLEQYRQELVLTMINNLLRQMVNETLASN
jgi:transcriptional regulator with XRE-family HTH domain